MSKSLLILIAGDSLLALAALSAGMYVRLGGLADPGEYEISLFRVVIFVLVAVFSSFFVELYSREKRFTRIEHSVRIGIALLIDFFVLSALYYLLPSGLVGRGVLIISLASFGVAQYIWHRSFPLILTAPGISQKILILGNGSLAKKIEEVMPFSRHNYVLAGYVRPLNEIPAIPDPRIVGTLDQIFETVGRIKPHKIIVSLAERRGVLPVREILRCKLSGVEVVDAMCFYEQLTGKLLIENINPSWFIFSEGFRVTGFIRFYKRVLDILFSFIGLVLAAPIIPLVALAVKFDSPGPVFFRQVRVGEGERPFTLVKFRTMCNDAEKNGAVWAQKDDPRVTRIGNFLRKSRLDEIPQLFNVLKGDMSFVGPRPERPEFIEKLEEKIPYYSKRHFVKPGVTGWAQVKYPYGASEEDAVEKLRYDLYYIKNLSILFDLLIICETVKVVLFGRGAR